MVEVKMMGGGGGEKTRGLCLIKIKNTVNQMNRHLTRSLLTHRHFSAIVDSGGWIKVKVHRTKCEASALV